MPTCAPFVRERFLPLRVHGNGKTATGVEWIAGAAYSGEVPEQLSVDVADHVAFVRLSRPEKMNALDVPTLQELVATAHRMRADRTLRGVLLSGDGPAFCAGIDLSVLSGGLTGFGRNFVPQPWRGTNLFQEACWAWRRVPVPVIAVVHGYCFGAGLQLALGADFRVSTPDAKWSVMESKWGLVPDMSGIRALAQLVSIDVAKQLAMTGRTISGEQARELGLVSRVAGDPHPAASELLEEILQRSPDAVAATKRVFEDTWPGSARRTFARERIEQARLLMTRNTRIVRAAAAARERPEFAPRAR